MRLAAAGLVLALAAGAAAQEAAPPTPAGDETAWHVVAPGETLEGLTAKYLGDAGLWRENWKLNPELKDPHRLQPGQRIRIIVRRKEHKAEIQGLSRRVESKPHPDPSWIPARLGEVLRERDGVRTYEKSSADLAFDDGTHLLVTEQSLVFLREIGARLVGDVTRRSIEIVDGQAEVLARAAPQPPPGLEIVLGEARALAHPAPAGELGTRARRLPAGTAQVMVYEGRGDVAAGGASVAVPRGMGTSVPKGGAPAPPEPLLPAPVLLAPSPGTAYAQSNPRFSWRPVAGAASYVVEVCGDPVCGRLVERATGVTETRWAPETLPLGELHVRVSAVAASGLDGYPSEAAPFRIESLWRRPEPPGPRR